MCLYDHLQLRYFLSIYTFHCFHIWPLIIFFHFHIFPPPANISWGGGGAKICVTLHKYILYTYIFLYLYICKYICVSCGPFLTPPFDFSYSVSTYCLKTVVVYSPVYPEYSTPRPVCTHNRPPPRQYSSHSAPSDINFICLIVSQRWAPANFFLVR